MDLDDLSKTFSLEPLLRVIPGEQRRLGLFIFLAALAHFVAFIFIHVNYPHFFVLPQPRIRIVYNYEGPKNLLRSNENFLDQWLDPSRLIFDPSPVKVPGGKPEAVAFVFESQKKVDFPLAQLTEENEFLPTNADSFLADLKNSLQPPLESFTYSEPEEIPSNPDTSIEWSASLRDRAPATLPKLPNPPAGPLTEAGVTVLNLAINNQGQIEHAMVQQSCGRSLLDLQALDVIKHSLFESSEKNSLTWGTATVFWRFESEKKPESEVKVQNPL